ncbi:MAG: CDP-diacylglycerol--glycerol-3-phosphate 3-phosphatidyltransferase [Candidatus Omnitrophica bacterium]|nr:CDP-diacylglycerol--glycerol-3-phosphate 3-phosphatidyltransferase [Candidatus Omnitrophota bacterium]MDD5430109.1 CDP-diacylglycerol--glycerol-3-phosphate 3-phosphatidyltransferase [Candidatus Omnitrophota bacterium]
MNIANKLTLLRVGLAFVCIGLILRDSLISLLLALVIFILASLTDLLDGYLARKKKLVSDLGKILDPIADKILIIGTFCAFLELGIINAWMVSLIMLREFIITGLRFYGLNKGVVLEARRLGKNKTVSQVTGICVIFIALILSKIFPASKVVFFLYSICIPVLMWYVVLITVFSGIHYFWANRKAIRTF